MKSSPTSPPFYPPFPAKVIDWTITLSPRNSLRPGGIHRFRTHGAQKHSGATGSVGDARGRLASGRFHLLRRRRYPGAHNPREESHRLCTRIPGILLRGTPHASGASENDQAARGARRGPRIESEQSGRLVRGPGREDFGRSAVGAGRLRCGARSDHRDRGAARRVGNGLK